LEYWQKKFGRYLKELFVRAFGISRGERASIEG
jgi:hypothetical protein